MESLRLYIIRRKLSIGMWDSTHSIDKICDESDGGGECVRQAFPIRIILRELFRIITY